MTSLARKTALVVGASSANGLGAAIARKLSGAGATVVLAARSEDKLAATASELDLPYHSCDVTDEASVERLSGWLSEHFGKLDIAVMAAGINHYSLIERFNPAKAEAVIKTQLVGGLLLIKHAAALMTGGGSIILISSLTARLPAPGTAVYAGTKAAMEHITRVAALEYADRGIRINGIAPGLQRTDMTEGLFANQAVEAASVRETPMGRLGVPTDIGSAAVWLAGDENFMTGETLPISGGAQLRRIPTIEEMTG